MLEIALHLKQHFLENNNLLKIKPFLLLTLLFLLPIIGFSQTATLKGVILDKNNLPISNVNIKANDNGAISNENGFYLIKIPANKNVIVEFTHLNFKKITATFNLKNGESFEFNPVLDTQVEQIETVVITSTERNRVEGITTIKPEIIRTIQGAQPGVENLLKTLPGVNISNELSTQYSVRGGNFDENLVYVNEIEVYRPFLIRS
jgi:hypothetical protein